MACPRWGRRLRLRIAVLHALFILVHGGRLGTLLVQQDSALAGRQAEARPSASRRSRSMRRFLTSMAAALLTASGGKGANNAHETDLLQSDPSEIFLFLDQNYDGHVDWSEYLAALDEAMLRVGSSCTGIAEQWCSSLFEGADIDGDGVLGASESEFLGFLLREAMSLRSPGKVLGDVQRDAPEGPAGDYLGDILIVQMKHLYDILDMNGDGTVDRNEYVSTVRKAAHEQGWEADFEASIKDFTARMFDKADLNHDDLLSMKEARYITFLAHAATQNGLFAKTSFINDMFDMYDFDQDGYVNIDEVMSVSGEQDEGSRDIMYLHMIAADSDKDGRLCRREAYTLADRMVQRGPQN
eukprot:CAMPEP_0176022968 /NCGR_PEP_ID=MMETSP0120_2-20121206/11194_1 /TAXON_ID=160619 /ORGANISM="Kryptoperidinium foliaceum, Strain CCMP 1326" /LENGTH=354 /DNA_ID=CAMNT_0017356121 /DNA_START=48 /DNA_END=1112 /DNA_ORIENTATION=+